MVRDLNYSQISVVIETWELARQIHGCEEGLGIEMLLNLFDLDPSTKTVFGFQADQNVRGRPMLRMGALTHGIKMLHMLDSVLSMLGPDTDILEELLDQFGEKHSRLGVKVDYFPLLGKALCRALQDVLKDLWTEEVNEAWAVVYKALSDGITKNMPR
jgi:hemoglobin-like flavoprotein